MEKEQNLGLWKKRVQKFLNNKLAVSGLIVFSFILLLCIFAPLVVKYDPNEVNLSLIARAPYKEHILGTDKLGRDVFSRILYGGRVSIAVGVFGATLAAIIGTVLGGIAGYFGGSIDNIIVRVSEVFLTFPSMIVILILAAIMGSGVFNIILVFAITGWMTTFRIVRNEFLSLKQETYVEVCRAFGYSHLRIIFNNILPNVLSVVIISLSLNVAGFVLGEAGLSFLGVGVPLDTPTWGNIINAAKSIDVIQNNWWLWIPPGLILTFFVLSINFIGDGLRDIMDPKQQ